MKKLFAVIFILFCLFCASTNNKKLFDIMDVCENGEVMFFCSQQENVDLNYYLNGEGFVYLSNLTDCKKNYLDMKNCYGIQFCFDDESVFEKLKKEICFFQSSQIEDIDVECGYSGGIVFSGMANKKSSNIQMAKTKNGVVVGVPIIFGWY